MSTLTTTTTIIIIIMIIVPRRFEDRRHDSEVRRSRDKESLVEIPAGVGAPDVAGVAPHQLSHLKKVKDERDVIYTYTYHVVG